MICSRWLSEITNKTSDIMSDMPKRLLYHFCICDTLPAIYRLVTHVPSDQLCGLQGTDSTKVVDQHSKAWNLSRPSRSCRKESSWLTEVPSSKAASQIPSTEGGSEFSPAPRLEVTHWLTAAGYWPCAFPGQQGSLAGGVLGVRVGAQPS